MSELFEEWDKNYDKMVAKDKKARKKGKLVGRYMREPIADGYAYYEIIKENKKTLRLKVIVGLGDDWRVPYWGDEANVDKNYVVDLIAFEDRLEKLFSKH